MLGPWARVKGTLAGRVWDSKFLITGEWRRRALADNERRGHCNVEVQERFTIPDLPHEKIDEFFPNAREILTNSC